MKLAVAKNGQSALSSDPNDFIFNSLYNTFKIVAEDTYIVSHNGSPDTQIFSVPHGLDFIPLVAAFILVEGETQAYPPNGSGVTVATSDSLITNGVKFDYVEADDTRVYFSITNTGGGKTINIRFLCLEGIL